MTLLGFVLPAYIFPFAADADLEGNLLLLWYLFPDNSLIFSVFRYIVIM